MGKKKFGFVYIWYDRKTKRYYIGCHWGREDDGYICSSRWMRRSYRRRPKDFKRRVITRIEGTREELYEEEYKWLCLIKEEELGIRYYNLSNHKFNHWSSDKNKLLTIGEKISASPDRNKNISKALRGNPLLSKKSEEQREKYRNGNKKQFSNPANREVVRQQMLALWQDPEYRKMQSLSHSKPRGKRKK